MEEIEITIVNWRKFNPEGERTKTPHWFRINRDIALSDSLDQLSAEQCWVWIQILAECCRKNSGTIMLKVAKLSRFSKVSKQCVCNALELLEKHGALRKSAKSTPSTLHNTTVHTIHNNTKTFCVELAKANSPPDADASHNGFLSSLSEESRNRLCQLYPESEFVNREVVKMQQWLSVNPRRTPKGKSGWSRFVMGWLERSWERHRKTIPSNQTPSGEINWDNVFKNEVVNEP